MRTRRLRVGFCYNLRADFPREPDSPADIDLDWDVPETVSHILAGVREAGYEGVDVGDPRRLVDTNVSQAIDLVFSICEMRGYRFREGLIPSLCEVLGLPYVMSPPDALMISLDKNLCNLVMRQAGVPVPDWTVIGNPWMDADRGWFRHFPYLVKPSAEGSGMGISRDCIVNDLSELYARVEMIGRQYRQPALVQTFLPGREFTVGLLERHDGLEVLKALEIVPRTPLDTFTYDAAVKERADALVEFVPVDGEPELEQRMHSIARTAFNALGCRDGARVDLRLSSEGVPYFLEINPLPHLHPEIGDYCRSARASGYSHPQLMGLLIDNAALRWRL